MKQRVVLFVLLAVCLGGCGASGPMPDTSGTGASPLVRDKISPASGPQTLVIDKVVVNGTPQHGTWLMCFLVKAGTVENAFNIPNKTYSGNGITIDMGLQLSPVLLGTPVSFKLSLDDNQGAVCTTRAEDNSTDSFQAGTGSKTVQRDRFSYVVHYHLQ